MPDTKTHPRERGIRNCVDSSGRGPGAAELISSPDLPSYLLHCGCLKKASFEAHLLDWMHLKLYNNLLCPHHVGVTILRTNSAY